MFLLTYRVLRLLRDMHNHAVELFRILFHQPRFVSAEVENLWMSAMADAHRYVHGEFCRSAGYISVLAADSAVCSASYLFCALLIFTVLQ